MVQYTPGTYLGFLKSAVYAKASNGNPQFCLTFDVTQIADNGNWIVVEPDERRVFLAYVGGAIPITDKQLENLGFNGNFAAPEFANTKEGTVLVYALGEYQGKTTHKWQLQSGPSEVEPADAAMIRQGQAQWNQRHKPIQRPASAAAPKPAAAKPLPMPANTRATRPPPQTTDPGTARPEDGEPPPAEESSGEEIPF